MTFKDKGQVVLESVSLISGIVVVAHDVLLDQKDFHLSVPPLRRTTIRLSLIIRDNNFTRVN